MDAAEEGMMGTQLSQEAADLLYLCGRALAGEPADAARVQAMNLPRVHALAAAQNLSALAWYGLESVADEAEMAEELARTWQAERDRHVRRQLLFAAERTQIMAWLSEAGIWHAPLKGAVLADWYPRVGMREFSDNDILFNDAHRAEVARFFKAHGYETEFAGGGVHDAYTKEPIYNFEMHRRLFSLYPDPKIAEYYVDVADRLVPAGDARAAGDEPAGNGPADASATSPFSLRLTREDFYVYLVAHVYKHYASAGTGVRILCDLRVFCDHEGNALDRAAVEHAFAELGIADFAHTLEHLANCVFAADFDPAVLASGDLAVLVALLSYGIYGTVEHQVELRLNEGETQGRTTGGYMLRRFFPDDDWWDINFPFALRHPWAKPPLLVYRTIRAALSPERRARVSAELRTLLRRRKR